MNSEEVFGHKMPNDTKSVGEQEEIKQERLEMSQIQEEAEREYKAFLQGMAQEQEEELKRLEQKYKRFYKGINKASVSPERFKPISYDVSKEILEEFDLLNLPAGVGVKGGAARSIMMKVLEMESVPVPRDIDLIFDASQIDLINDSEEVTRLMQYYMPDDFKFNDSLASLCVFDDEQEHFSTQDFTMNELYYLDGQIHGTSQGISDLEGGVIRITGHEKENWGDGFYIGPKMMTKALRFWSRLIKERGEAQIAEFETLDFGYVPTFWLYLNMRKAIDENNDVAETFWGKIVKTIFETEHYHDNPNEDFSYKDIFKACGDDPEKVLIYLTLHLDNLSGEKEELIHSLGNKYDHREPGLDIAELIEKIQVRIEKGGFEAEKPSEGIPVAIYNREALENLKEFGIDMGHSISVDVSVI